MKKRLSGHTAYKTEYHVVWVTKYRKPVLNLTRRRYLVGLFSKIVAKMPGCEVVEYNVLVDHVHMVMVIPPKYAVKDVVGRLKGITSSRLRKRFPRLAMVYWKDNVVWSPGYFVSTVGIGEEKILNYVRNQ
ncbi:IS200/IS605 family transposase [Chloroflexota bacterium]